MTNQIQSSNAKIFDLSERTARFGENVIEFLQSVKNNLINNELMSQLVRSATSIGANYEEADGAVSKKDFRNKIGICKKESKESRHWLRMIAKANPAKSDDCRKLWKEAHELTLIFSKIVISSQGKK